MKLLVLGGGAQGSAAAFDLLRTEGVEEVVLADHHLGRVAPFLEPHVGGKLRLVRLDASDRNAVWRAMEEMDAALCALPYFFGLPMAELAIESGTHYCDLGGNTEIVERQRTLDGAARAKGVSVIPDCGLAPGMVNVLAQAGIDELDEIDQVKLLVGGLPQHPRPPLNYQVVYSLEGVLDYYTTSSIVLAEGEIQEREALSEVEPVRFPEPLGELEAFHTAGGISTLPHRYRGRVRSMEYKTLRYPGHAEIMRAFRDLGFFSTRPRLVGGVEVVPRRFFIDVVGPQLASKDGEDLVALRVDVKGRREGRPAAVRFELLDRYDREHHVTAMMRTTGYSLALTAVMQVDGRISAKGVHTPDECVPAGEYVREMGRRGVEIRRVEAAPA
jgi:lysine 6-dehydrogenase